MADSGLPDTCIEIRDGNPYPWLSPDINLYGPLDPALNCGNLGGRLPTDRSVAGVSNLVCVNVQRRFGASPTLDSSSVIRVELWVGNPSLAMAPGYNTTKISDDNIHYVLKSNLPSGGSASVGVRWTPPSTVTNPDDPQAPGHRCLIARAYPNFGNRPDPGDFHQWDDQHSAQHNITILPVGSVGAATAAGARKAELEVSTVCVNPSEPEQVTVRVIADLDPDESVRDFLRPRLKEEHGFKRIAKKAPKGFELRMKDHPRARVRDESRPGRRAGQPGARPNPKFEADIELEPKQLTHFTFAPDLSDAEMGDAHVFHLMQVGPDGRTQGGLTVVTVVG